MAINETKLNQLVNNAQVYYTLVEGKNSDKITYYFKPEGYRQYATFEKAGKVCSYPGYVFRLPGDAVERMDSVDDPMDKQITKMIRFLYETNYAQHSGLRTYA